MEKFEGKGKRVSIDKEWIDLKGKEIRAAEEVVQKNIWVAKKHYVRKEILELIDEKLK